MILSKTDYSTIYKNKKKDRVFLVGGGPSISTVDLSLLKNEDTICVNCSVVDVPNPKYFITVDYTFLHKSNRAFLKNSELVKIFIADFSFSFMVEENGTIFDNRYRLEYKLHEFDFLIKSFCPEGFGFSWEDFRCGRNSGYCALQLAVLLGYTEIYLIGFDLKTQQLTHYHGGYGESQQSFDLKLQQYLDYFLSGIPKINEKGISLFSCSQISSLNNIIPYCNSNKVLRVIK